MKHHILAIGISKHQNSGANLSYAAKDATEFHNLFVSNIGNIGYKTLLTDTEASLAQIQTALGSDLQQAIQPEDAFFFFYSGHGGMAEDTSDDSQATMYLVPYDATHDIASSCISVTYLQEALEKLPCKAKLIFIDSCFSGCVSKNSKGYPISKKKAFKGIKSFTNTVMGSGTLIFTASKDEEESIEDPKLEHGLFTYFVLQELLRQRDSQLFPAMQIFSPVAREVGERAQKEWHHTQTPTFNGKLEGDVLLPTFKEKLKVRLEIIEIPKNPALSSMAFPPPALTLGNEEQFRLLNETIEFVIRGKAPSDILMQEILFERLCNQLLREIKNRYEETFAEVGGDSNKLPQAVATLEGAAFQFVLLGGVTAAFGSSKQMEIYARHVVELLYLTRGRAGLKALINLPEVIVIDIAYVVGVICLTKENFEPLQLLLRIEFDDFEYAYADHPPRQLSSIRSIHYTSALGGYASKIHDHVREYLGSLEWLTQIAPRLEGKIHDMQLQTNFIITALYEHNGNPIWPDFGRWEKIRILPLIRKIKYKSGFRKSIAAMLSVDDEKVCSLLSEYVVNMRKRGLDRYWWNSIDGSELLPEEEKQIKSK